MPSSIEGPVWGLGLPTGKHWGVPMGVFRRGCEQWAARACGSTRRDFCIVRIEHCARVRGWGLCVQGRGQGPVVEGADAEGERTPTQPIQSGGTHAGMPVRGEPASARSGLHLSSMRVPVGQRGAGGGVGLLEGEVCVVQGWGASGSRGGTSRAVDSSRWWRGCC